MDAKEKIKITVIDDDSFSLAYACGLLRTLGYSARGASDPDFALSVDSQAADLLILDLHMPKTSGFKILEQRKKSHPRIAEVPVLVLSGDKTKQSVLLAIACGASDYLLKPLNSEVLNQKIEHLLRDRIPESVVLEKRLKMKVNVDASILRMSETHMIVKSAVKLSQSAPFDVSSELLQEIELTKTLFKRTKRRSFLTDDDLFLNEISFVGMNLEMFKRIQKKVL